MLRTAALSTALALAAYASSAWLTTEVMHCRIYSATLYTGITIDRYAISAS